MTTALICGSLDLQNGFAYVLQGGASRFGRQAFPAAVQFNLLLQLVAESAEDLEGAELHVEVRVVSNLIKSSHPNLVGTVALGTERSDSLIEGEMPTILLPMPVAFVAPAPGLYEVQISAGSAAQTLPFAVHATEVQDAGNLT